MVNVKCTGCNGEIRLDNTKEFGFCSHCGQKISLKEVNEQIPNQSKIDNYLKIASDALDEGQSLERIDEYLNKVFEIDYDNWRAHWYKFLSRVGRDCKREGIANIKENLEKVVKLFKKSLIANDSNILSGLYILASSKIADVCGNRIERYLDVDICSEHGANKLWNDLRDDIEVMKLSIEFANTAELLAIEKTNAIEQKKANIEMQLALLCLLCEMRSYEGINKRSYEMQTFWIGISDQERTQIVTLYDWYVKEIQLLNPSYIPALQIRRTGYKKGLSGGKNVGIAIIVCLLLVLITAVLLPTFLSIFSPFKSFPIMP